MKFGSVAVDRSEGVILAHAVKGPGLNLKKGEVVTSAHIAILKAAGIRDLIAARLEADDVHENKAACMLATALAGDHITLERAFTGRCNLVARSAGLLMIDHAVIDGINAVDEAITVATLQPFHAVEPGEMIATIKIIPFSVPRSSLSAALAMVSDDALRIAPFRPLRVGVVSTILPGLKKSVVGKTLSILQARLAPAGATIVVDSRTAHEVDALAVGMRDAARQSDLVVVFGASAITDRRDVIPAGIEAAGGEVLHLGMPVDPGNLLLLGKLPLAGGGTLPVIGAPGCARSPKENGFDFVLRRHLAGLSVTPMDLRRMGVGGLLSEITSRPQPRDVPDAQDA